MRFSAVLFFLAILITSSTSETQCATAETYSQGDISIVHILDVASAGGRPAPGFPHATINLLLSDDSNYLVLPSRLLRYSGELNMATNFKEITFPGAYPSASHYVNGRLFILSAPLQDDVSGRKAYAFSDDAGESWVSLEDQFHATTTSQQGTVIHDWLWIDWLHATGDGLLYCNAGGFVNTFVSGDFGLTWELVAGERASMIASMGARLVFDRTLLIGGEAPSDMAWIRRAVLSEDGASLESGFETILDWETLANRNIMVFQKDFRSGVILAGAEGAVLQSVDKGLHFTFAYIFPRTSSSDPPYPEPIDTTKYPYVTSILVCRDYANRFIVGGFDKVAYQAYLAYSDSGGAPGSWIDLSDTVDSLGNEVVFLESDPRGEYIVGAFKRAEPTGRSGTLTIAELKLPDPVRDRYPEVERLGEGWWREAALGKFNAQWYPHQWHADWRGWAWNAETAASGGHVLRDADIGWVWMGEGIHPYAWHYNSGEFVRLATERPGRVFQRYEDGAWVDIGGEGGE